MKYSRPLADTIDLLGILALIALYGVMAGWLIEQLRNLP